jgi:hypothetical protein
MGKETVLRRRTHVVRSGSAPARALFDRALDGQNHPNHLILLTIRQGRGLEPSMGLYEPIRFRKPPDPISGRAGFAS